MRRNDATIGLIRNGGLQVNAQGEINNQDGNPLVPPLKLPTGADADNIRIEPDGQIISRSRTLGKIALVNVPAPNQLQPDGDSMFSVTAGSGAAGSSIQQGTLEGSNVDVAQEVAGSELSQFTANQKAPILIWDGQGHQIINQARACSPRSWARPGTPPNAQHHSPPGRARGSR